MNRSWQTLSDHLGIDISNGLTDPRELEPDPLLIVVEAHFLACLVVRLLQIFSELFLDQRLLQLLYFNYLQLPLQLILFVVFAVLRLEGQLLFFDEALLVWSKVVLQVLFHRAGEEMTEFLLVGQYAHVQLLDIQRCLCMYGLTLLVLGRRCLRPR